LRSSILISDFDGSVTGVEFYALATPQLLGSAPPDYWSLHLRGRISHFEAMRRVFTHFRCDESALRQAVRQLEPDPDLAGAIERLGQAGWDVEIVSAGCCWYIDQVLEASGVNIPVHANPGRFSPSEGLVMELPLDSPFCSPETGIDKAAAVRHSLPRYRRVAYAGDGPTDLEPALLVAPKRRFATGWLAGELDRQGAPFRHFSRWSQIAEALLSEA
jgi:2,3-diketo-5-methylthio-1-phosphopentane phosphatase